jgi:hypothetical protein
MKETNALQFILRWCKATSLSYPILYDHSIIIVLEEKIVLSQLSLKQIISCVHGVGSDGVLMLCRIRIVNRQLNFHIVNVRTVLSTYVCTAQMSVSSIVTE